MVRYSARDRLAGFSARSDAIACRIPRIGPAWARTSRRRMGIPGFGGKEFYLFKKIFFKNDFSRR